MTSSSEKSDLSRVVIGLVVVGGVAGMVFGARYMRDMQGLSKDTTRVAKASGFVTPKKIPTAVLPTHPPPPIPSTQPQQQQVPVTTTPQSVSSTSPSPSAIHTTSPPLKGEGGKELRRNEAEEVGEKKDGEAGREMR